MTGLLIFSFILVVLHILSIRILIKTNYTELSAENLKKTENILPSIENSTGFSINLAFPILVIFILSFIEIGYFAFSVFILKDFIIVSGASILTGYNLYSMLKFFPDLKLFSKNPAKFFKRKENAFDSALNIIMAFLEILFCTYVIIKIFIKYGIFLEI